MTLRLAITAGEPAGIGPDLCIQIAQQAHAHELVVIADPAVTASSAPPSSALPLKYPFITTPNQHSPLPLVNFLCPVTLAQPVRPGNCRWPTATMYWKPCASPYRVHWISVGRASSPRPVHKGIINDAGIAFSGHTEYFRDYCGVKEVVMMLATSDLRVALVTTHLPLKDVPAAITPERIKRVNAHSA